MFVRILLAPVAGLLLGVRVRYGESPMTEKDRRDAKDLCHNSKSHLVVGIYVATLEPPICACVFVRSEVCSFEAGLIAAIGASKSN